MKNDINVDMIKKFIKDNNLTVADFCKKSRISYGVYKKIITGQVNFRTNALLKLARILKVEICQLFI